MKLLNLGAQNEERSFGEFNSQRTLKTRETGKMVINLSKWMTEQEGL